VRCAARRDVGHCRRASLSDALTTAVAGIALTGLFAPTGRFGAVLEPAGIKVAFTPLGVLVALTFISLPFAPCSRCWRSGRRGSRKRRRPSGRSRYHP
jgi:hypothetical protein